jgi:hypothetical protein
MAGGRLALSCALVLASASCGSREDPSAGDGASPPTAQPSGATQPAAVCGVSNVVSGQEIWGLQLAVAGGQVLYTTYGEGTDQHHHALWSVAAGGGEPSNLWLGPSGILGGGIAVVDGKVYFSSQLAWGESDEGVLLVPEVGGAPAHVAAKFGTPCAAYGGMVVDDANVYAAASGCPVGVGQIIRVPRGGGAVSSLWMGDHLGDGAASIAVHGTDLYFLRDDDDDGDGALMQLSTTQGSIATEIGALDEAHGLAVDDDGVYVTLHDALVLVPADGSPAVTLASQLHHPSLVAVDETGIYVAAGDLEDGATGQVLRVPHGGGAPVVLASNQPAIFALALDDVVVYWASQTGGLVARAGKCL